VRNVFVYHLILVEFGRHIAYFEVEDVCHYQLEVFACVDCLLRILNCNFFALRHLVGGQFKTVVDVNHSDIQNHLLVECIIRETRRCSEVRTHVVLALCIEVHVDLVIT